MGYLGWSWLVTAVQTHAAAVKVEFCDTYFTKSEFFLLLEMTEDAAATRARSREERKNARASYHGDSLPYCRTKGVEENPLQVRWSYASVLVISSGMVHVERGEHTKPNKAAPGSTTEHQLVFPPTQPPGRTYCLWSAPYLLGR